MLFFKTFSVTLLNSLYFFFLQVLVLLTTAASITTREVWTKSTSARITWPTTDAQWLQPCKLILTFICRIISRISFKKTSQMSFFSLNTVRFWVSISYFVFGSNLLFYSLSFLLLLIYFSLITMKGAPLCVDPKLNWVERVMTSLDQKIF